jgi:shikimate dehydrogenase
MKLAEKFHCEYSDYEKIDWDNVDILINASSIGMMPNIDESPISIKCRKEMIVFDSVYNPLVTKLIHDAGKTAAARQSAASRCSSIKASKQIKIWTGKNIDKNFAEDTVLQYVVYETCRRKN